MRTKYGINTYGKNVSKIALRYIVFYIYLNVYIESKSLKVNYLGLRFEKLERKHELNRMEKGENKLKSK